MKGKCLQKDARSLRRDSRIQCDEMSWSGNEINPSLTQGQMLRFRRAQVGDAQSLCKLASRLFTETFGEFNTSENMNAYLREHFQVKAQAAELQNGESHEVWLACAFEPAAEELSGTRQVISISKDSPNEKMIGYLHLIRGSSLHHNEGVDSLEIRRFYIDSHFHGKGVAQVLLRVAEKRALEVGAKHLWLAVWERNDRARAFYRKCGFLPIGSKDFLLGEDLQKDIVMQKACES